MVCFTSYKTVGIWSILTSQSVIALVCTDIVINMLQELPLLIVMVV